MEKNKLPFNVRVLEAKNALKHAALTIGGQYELPGVVLDLILSEILSDERQAHLALIAEQFTQKGEKSADTRSEHKDTD